LSNLATAELAASKITSEQGIVVVSGALEGMERALQAQLHPGDVVAVEDPGFAGLFDLLRALGLALRPVPIDARGMKAAALAGALGEGAQAVVFNPRGQNPTGASLDATRAAELRQVLDQCPDAMVIEDDHLGSIAGAPFLTLTNDRRRWAVVRSIAKSLGPDLRLAILAGDARTMSRVRGRQALGPHWVSHLLQRLVAMLLSDRTVVTGLAHAARTYSRRRERLVAALRERGIEVHAQAGITVWILVPDEAHVVQALLQRGWAVSPGAPYRLQSERAVRVTISALQEDEADDLASAIANALRPSLRTRTP
jgi:DNA-binding transcriptional MocR family regulator